MGRLAGIVPWDALKEKCPDEYERLVKKGATRYEIIGNRTLVSGDEGIIAELPFDIGDISRAPHLKAGDLLLLRGDIIHKTQDAETKRIALSIRLTNPNTIVNRSAYISGGLIKTRKMLNNWPFYGAIAKVFQASGKEDLSWKELSEEIEDLRKRGGGIEAKPIETCFYLFWQKLATGTFFLH